MCAIVGAILKSVSSPLHVNDVNRILSIIWERSHARGRDGRGYLFNSVRGSTSVRDPSKEGSRHAPQVLAYQQGVLIGNLRAEPTTEFVLDKKVTDQQPYTIEHWSIVHNGTIANDKELRTGELPTSIDSAAIVELLASSDPEDCRYEVFKDAMSKLKGSFAILAHNTCEFTSLFVAANYRPVWYAVTPYGVFFASARDYFPEDLVPQMLTPYTIAEFDSNGIIKIEPLPGLQGPTNRALVVCSGGLDSVVAATVVKNQLNMETELIHFCYGSRAEEPEIASIKKVAEFLGVKYTIFPLPVYKESDSPLLDKGSIMAGGEAGAEFAYEWVPARNLLLLSVATAYAEANGFDTLVLGNNLEEAGAYPDNEPEFIAKFNDLLPFAIGDGKRMKVIMPVGNLMKHEIVALGHSVGAPMHLTWSCYRYGEKHCGKCGPCYMRRTAFQINHLEEVIQYEGD